MGALSYNAQIFWDIFLLKLADLKDAVPRKRHTMKTCPQRD